MLRAGGATPAHVAVAGILVAFVLAGCTVGTPSAAPSGMISTRAPGVADIVIAESGALEARGTTRPEVSWSAVEGATLYRLVVEQPDGPSWAWSGEATSVILGGGSVIDQQGPGFTLTGEAQLWWAAFGNDGDVLATDRLVLPAP